MAARALLFESGPCSRCGGSGHYSYCQRYGTTCFKCAGRTVTLTKRGAAANAYFREILPTKLPAALRIGDRVECTGLTHGGDVYTAMGVVTGAPAASETTSSYTRTSLAGLTETVTERYVNVPVRDAYKVESTHGMLADTRVTVFPTGIERECFVSIALGYQDTLSATGKATTRPRRALTGALGPVA